ncbi:hypothetical protein JCM10207_003138 [Rhodosporidiobolus poonsookiae]
MAMGASPSTVPPFLLITSRPALLNILSTLGEREQQRRLLAEEGRMRNAIRDAHARDGNGAALRELDDAAEDAGGQPGAKEEGGWFSVAVGTQADNLRKNRYGDIVAYDRTRCLPPLRTTAAKDAPSYVNASLVRELDLGLEQDQVRRRWWVAAQAPIPSTVHDFLSLLLTPPTSLAHKALSSSASSSAPSSLPLIQTIVQLTPLVEGSRAKCHPYFPPNIGERWDLPSASKEAGQGVWVRLDSKAEKDGARTSELRVGKEGDEEGRRIVHLEYLGWRDHGVPDSPTHLVRFIQRMHALNAITSPSSSDEPPILIHCSAGVGRTGTTIAISSLLPFLSHLRSNPSLLDALPTPPPPTGHPLGAYPTTGLLPGGVPDYVGATVDALRDQRTTMAQTQDQTLFIYQALIAAWETGLV